MKTAVSANRASSQSVRNVLTKTTIPLLAILSKETACIHITATVSKNVSAETILTNVCTVMLSGIPSKATQLKDDCKMVKDYLSINSSKSIYFLKISLFIYPSLVKSLGLGGTGMRTIVGMTDRVHNYMTISRTQLNFLLSN